MITYAISTGDCTRYHLLCGVLRNLIFRKLKFRKLKFRKLKFRNSFLNGWPYPQSPLPALGACCQRRCLILSTQPPASQHMARLISDTSKGYSLNLASFPGYVAWERGYHSPALCLALLRSSPACTNVPGCPLQGLLGSGRHSL